MAQVESGELAPRAILAVVGALMLGNLLAVIDLTVVVVALPTIAAEFDSVASSSWVLVAYSLSLTVMVPLYGKLSDLYGRKSVYQAAIVVFLVGSMLCGVSQSMAQLIAARAVQGIGAGGLMVSSLAILGEVVSARHRGTYQAYLTVVTSVGIVSGPAIGGLLVDHLSWRWIFFVNIPVGLVALVTVGAALHLPVARVEHKIDFTGAGLMVAGVTAVLLALSWGGERYAWGSGQVLGLLGVGAVLLALFVRQEGRAREPVLPMRIFRSPNVVPASAFMLVFFASTGAATLIPLQQIVQVVLARPPSDAWMFLWPLALANIAAAVVTGRVVARTGRYKIFPLLATAFGVIMAVGFIRYGVDSSGVELALLLALLGVALGLGQMVPIIAAQNAAPREDLGVATSTVNFFNQMANVLGATLFGTTIFTTHLERNLDALALTGAAAAAVEAGPSAIRALPDAVRLPIAEAYVSAFHDVWYWALPFVCLSALLALWIREVPLKSWSFAVQDALGGALEGAALPPDPGEASEAQRAASNEA